LLLFILQVILSVNWQMPPKWDNQPCFCLVECYYVSNWAI